METLVNLFRYLVLHLKHPKRIKIGDNVKCLGIGYPHWKGMEFKCTMDFRDGTIGVDNALKVKKIDFIIP